MSRRPFFLALALLASLAFAQAAAAQPITLNVTSARTVTNQPDPVQLRGTVSIDPAPAIAGGGSIVTGVGTHFDTDLQPGDLIKPATAPGAQLRWLVVAPNVAHPTTATSMRVTQPPSLSGRYSGPLVAGNVGTESRYEYTVIGRPVNEAARLSDLAKGKPSRVLSSQEAIARAGDEAAKWVSVGNVALRGQSAPTEVYEPLEVREPATA